MDKYNELLQKVQKQSTSSTKKLVFPVKQAEAVAKPVMPTKLTPTQGRTTALPDRKAYQPSTRTGYQQALQDNAGARFHAGVMEGLSPISLGLESEALDGSKAFLAGNVAGTMGQFAIPYAGVAPKLGKALSNIPKYANMGKVGQAVARGVATDLTVGVPLNTLYGVSKEGLEGKELIKSIGINTAIDLVAGGLFEIIPAGVKGMKRFINKQTGAVVAEATDEVVEQAVKAVGTPQDVAYNPPNRPVQPRNTETGATIPIKEQTPVKKAIPGKRDLGADDARPTQTLDEARAMYGTIEPGMEPRARDAQIPKAINDQPIQQGIRTSAEARAVNKESYQEILSAVEDGMAAKVTVKNQVAVENASKTIAEDGLDVAYGKFKSVLDGGKQAKSEDIALGYRLMQEYQNAGDYGRVSDVAIDVSEMLSETGRSLQAAAIIKKLSPEGRLMSTQRIAKKLSDRLGKDIRLDDETIDQILKARTEAEIVEASQKAGVKIWNQVPSGLQNKANAWRYMSMLMNPKTHIRNIVGNLAFMPARGLKNIIGTGLERMSRVKVGQRTKAIINPLNKNDQTLLKLADKDFSEVRNILRGEAKYDDVVRPLEAKVFNTKILEAGRKLNLNLLDGEDIFFMRAAYDSSFAQYMKANKIDINNLDFATLQKARNYAADEALKATYRDYNKLASSISKLKHNLATSPAQSTSALWFKRGAGVALEGVLPFTKTPMNLLRRGIEYSPVSLATGVNDMLKAIRQGKVPPAAALDRLAAGMSGTGILLLGMLLQKQGIVVGGSDNQYSSKQYQWETMTGMQEYAIDTGDGTYTLDWAAPMSMPFFVGVELSKMLGQDEGSFVNIADAITAIDEPIFNMSMLQGINQALNTWSQSEGIGGALGEIGFNMALSYAGQFVPTVGGQIARTADDYRRVTTSTKESATVRKLDREFKRQKGKIPLANKNEPYIDLWGRKESSGGAVQNFISPGYYRPQNKTKVDEEIGKLIESLDPELAKDVIPRVTNSYTITQDKVDYRLSEKELTRFKEVRGKESYDGMNRLINSSAYQKMSPEEKVKAIKKVYDSAYQKAKEELLKRRAAIPTKK